MHVIFTILDQISSFGLSVSQDKIYIDINGIFTKKKSTQKNQLKVVLDENAGYLNEIILACVPEKIDQLLVYGNYDIVNFTKVKEKMMEISDLMVGNFQKCYQEIAKNVSHICFGNYSITKEDFSCFDTSKLTYF